MQQHSDGGEQQKPRRHPHRNQHERPPPPGSGRGVFRVWWFAVKPHVLLLGLAAIVLAIWTTIRWQAVEASEWRRQIHADAFAARRGEPLRPVETDHSMHFVLYGASAVLLVSAVVLHATDPDRRPAGEHF